MTELKKNLNGDQSKGLKIQFCILRMITLPINIIPFQFYFDLKIKSIMETFSYLNIDNILQIYKVLIQVKYNITLTLHCFFIECVAICSFVLRGLVGRDNL